VRYSAGHCIYCGSSRIYCSEGLQDMPLGRLLKVVWRQCAWVVGNCRMEDESSLIQLVRKVAVHL
jgi:hypothetical protein